MTLSKLTGLERTKLQEEFDALWNDRRAMDLSVCPFIAQDVQRIRY